MDIREIAKEYNDYLIEMRRWFHAHPEIAEKEFETSKKIKEELVCIAAVANNIPAFKLASVLRDKA